RRIDHSLRPQLLPPDLRVPEIYTRNNWSTGDDPNLTSRYIFEVRAQSVASRISLGFNLLQGSEQVTAGGRTLVRDRDYTIDYDTGEIEILDAADVSDTDEIRVSYSYLPFGGGGQKTLMGSALRYAPPRSKMALSTTWVYESKGAPGVEGRRPRLGQEPTRTVVGELAGSYKTDSWGLTSLVDAIPGISTRQRSSLTLDGGLGLSFPDPNTTGELYIDDFEGAKDEYLVTMNRLGWRPSGIPRAAQGATASQQAANRGVGWWYSPRSAVKEGDLQPTDEGSGGLDETEKDNNRTILELHFFPNGSTPEEKRDSWFSLVQPLSTRGTDLSRAQFLDLWVNDFLPLDQIEDREGKIHIEIGVVSENAIWNRVRPEDLGPDSFEPPDFELNTEDENRDGELDDPGGGQGEDTGMDGLTDAEEGTGADPAYDNWEFAESDEDQDRRAPRDDPTRTQRYARINGTQSNGRLDTEDLNGNLILDESEAYFHFSVDLSDTSLVEYEASQAPDQDPDYAPYTRGWRRVRIPLTSADSARVGSPNWQQVRHLRLWFEGFSEETYLQIGGVEITGNRWLKGVVQDSTGEAVSDSLLLAEGEDFFPAVLNNKDNSTAEYTPPFPPRERQDVEEREQSLTLEMINFQAGHTGTVFRTYNQGQDFANLYRSLEFFLNRRIREGPTPDLDFFVRFCRDAATDTTNFYEYRVPVPDGWRLIELDLEELSRLQLVEGCRSDSCNVTKTLPDGAVIRRKGNPNLTSVWRITFGVVNRGPTAVVSGNVWIDELRLTDVKRDTGLATRLGVGVVLADFASVNFNFQRTGANFLRIGSELGSGNTVTNYSLNSRMNFDKFLQGTGITLPLTFSMARSKTVPKFQSDSDLVLERATDRDISESMNQDFSFNLSRTRSESPWLRYTIDAFSVSGRIDSREENNPWSRIKTTGRSGNIQYSLPLGGGPSIRLYRNTDLHLLPTNFLVGVSGDLRKTTEFSRNSGDINQDFVRIPRKNTKSGRMTWSTGLRPIDQITYSFNQSRDLRLRIAEKSLLGLNLGTETSRRHKLSASEQVDLAELGLLPQSLNIVPKVSWNGSFDGTFNMIRATGDEGGERTNRFSNSSNATFSGAIPVGRLLKMLSPFGKGDGSDGAAEGDSAAPRRAVRSRRSRGRSGGGGLLSIGAVTATYTIGKSNSLEGIRGEPSIGYQLGWARDPGPDVIRSGTGARASSGDRKDLNLSTDVKLLSEISVRTTYKRSVNVNSVNGGESENRSRTFPDLSINWGRIHRKLGLEGIARDLRASSGYSRKITETITGIGRGSERINTRIAFNPLLNIDARLENGITAKLTSSYNKDTNEQKLESINNVNTTVRRQVGVTLSRSINLSRMVTNPITKKRSRVTSKLDVSLSGNYSENKTETRQGERAIPGRHNVLFDVSTSAGYNFTSNISGNAAISFSQNTDKKNRANTVRSVSVTISAAFRF
ncbi:MAG: cell surface protein SprA, partial [Candidatus Eisenbacteria bacterium]|nr:cell surface protein SprA [Candidatus Latescibacterota bacterium]MBD3302743.1 cell surface protein SprA [Candidatus Eisenbacteria bacterium]